jgi:hypothetical protein
MIGRAIGKPVVTMKTPPVPRVGDHYSV